MQSDTKNLDVVIELRRELKDKDNQIKQLKLENDELKVGLSQNNIDTLTGLLNRQSFENELKKINNTQDSVIELSLILIDIDNFKVVNDQFGHFVGDEFLREFAQLLKETALTAELIGRIGGGEFCVAIQKNVNVAYDLADLMRSQTESSLWKILNKPITISVGVAEIKPEQSCEELFAEADRCLYAAKSEGRNRVISASDLSPSAESEDLILVDLENRIRVMTERLTQYMILRSKRIANHYKKEAALDGLTGVYNRGYLDRILGREVDKSITLQRVLTVIMIDIDDFGEINKLYNWTAGDLAVKTVASVIQKQVRANDWVARYGGDEFIVVMPDTKRTEGIKIAERIREILEKTHIKTNNKIEFQLTVSIGIIESNDAKSPQAIYELVGTSTRKAKMNGKNRVI